MKCLDIERTDKYTIITILGLMRISFKKKLPKDRILDNSKSIITSVPVYGLNIGGGAWKCAGWNNLDWYANDELIDYKLNLLESQELPIESERFKYVFSSHVIEHLKDEQVQKLFFEVYRILDIGGVFRISCPDADKAIIEYKNNNKDFFWNDEIYLVGDSIERRLVNFFASFRCKNYCGLDDYSGGPFVEVLEVEQNFNKLSKDNFIQWCVSKIPSEAYYTAHINGFYYGKIENMLYNSGFEVVFKSSYKKSIVKEMRLDSFDNRGNSSVFVEAIKR